MYRLLREKGVYAIFVLEDESRNASGKWVDYKNAKQILDDKEVEYSEYYNEKADIVFTTQGVEILTKYSHSIKIALAYGPAFNNDDF